MTLYKNLKILREEYINRKPKEIKVFVVYDTERNYFYYHFLFSEENVLRREALLKSHYPNTVSLFNKIIEEFIQGKRIVSVEYTTLKIDCSYIGMSLVNEEGFALSVYFSDLSLPFFNWYDTFFSSAFYQENLAYAFHLISEGQVNYLDFLSNGQDVLQVHYFDDQNSSLSSFQKENYLKIQYKKVEGQINKTELCFMLCILRAFLTFHFNAFKIRFIDILSKVDGVTCFHILNAFRKGFLKLPLSYHYSSLIVSETDLKFYLSGNVAYLQDSTLVDFVEKDAIVDELHKAMAEFFNIETFSDEAVLKKSLK